MSIKFCTQCGNPVELGIPEGDNRPRHTCTACGHIHYLNPHVVTGCLVHDGDHVLLCKRAIEPRLGYWTLPAGFMELDETTRQAAARETLEEADIQVETGPLFLLATSIRANHVNMFYLAELNGQHFRPTPESTEVRLFARDEIPWEQIAFTTVRHALEYFYADADQGVFGLHEIDFLAQ